MTADKIHIARPMAALIIVLRALLVTSGSTLASRILNASINYNADSNQGSYSKQYFYNCGNNKPDIRKTSQFW